MKIYRRFATLPCSVALSDVCTLWPTLTTMTAQELSHLTKRIASGKLRCLQLMLMVSLAGLAPAARAEIMLYEFVPDQSELVLAGGLAGFYEPYTITGSLALDVDFAASVASFVEVDATLMAVSGEGFLDSASLDPFLNMTGATGTVVDPTTLTFTSMVDEDRLSYTVLLDVELMPSSLTLVGSKVAEQCVDCFYFPVDAVAELVPEPSCFLLCAFGCGLVALSRRRSPHTDSQFPR